MTAREVRPRRVALYCRVSTSGQDALQQVPRLREWAARQGYTVAMEQVEVASGRLQRRPGLDAIIRAAKARHIDAVACWRLDRWGRSLQHVAQTVADFQAWGVAFHAPESGINLVRDDPNANLTLNILAAVAQWEVQMLSARTKEGIEAFRSKNRGGAWGPQAAVCHDCMGQRPPGQVEWGKRRGNRVPLCATCKAAGSEKGFHLAQRVDALELVGSGKVGSPFRRPT